MENQKQDNRRSKKGPLFPSSYRKKRKTPSRLKKQITHIGEILPEKSTTVEVDSASLEFQESSRAEMALEVLGNPGCDPAIDDINGRFIVDGKHFLREVRSLENHRSTCLQSSNGYFRLVSTSTRALVWRLLFECPYCKLKKVVTSEPELNATSSPAESEKEEKKLKLNIIDSAVWGFMAIGGGHANLEEVFSALGVKSVDKSTFQVHEEKLGKAWKSVLFDNILKAGEEEKRLALANGDVSDSGVPFITVVVDGGWSHRSYGHRYSANSGVICVIGYRTKKLLHLDVRNKYCSMCEYLSSKNMPADHENCYRNWTGSSSAMEADMVVQAFRCSKDLHGLEYHSMIADGDSSVYKKVRDYVPYGRNVQKIECANHAVKCYTRALYKILAARPDLKGTLTKMKIIRLKKAARGAIIHNAKEGNSKEALVEDFRNGPHHVFGSHKNCKAYYCDNSGEEHKELSAKEEVAIEKIHLALKYLIRKSGQLITDDTSNLAENFMSLVAKFIGGKQINRGKRGSYLHRVQGAGLDYQMGPMWHYNTWKSLCGISPYKSLTAMCERKRKRRQSTRKCLIMNKTNTRKERKRKKSDNGSEDYGELCQKLDMDDDEFRQEVISFLEKQKVNEESRNYLLQCTQGQVECEKWFEERKNRVTASNFGPVCKRRKNSKWAPLVNRFLYSDFFENAATKYGLQNEGEAVKEYTKLTGRKVTSCGLFVDLEHSFLAASPDGITEDGGLIEVKCPKSAEKMTLEEAAEKLKGFCLDRELKLKKNHNYHYQIQGQLHVSGFSFCDFVVWTPKECFIQRIYKDDEFWKKNMEEKLVLFYMNAMLPEIVDPRVCRSMEIREPEETTKNVLG